MRKFRRVVSECVIEMHLARGVVQMIIAADHMRDLHVSIVQHDTEIVSWKSVGPYHNQIIQLDVVKDHGALDEVFYHSLPCLRGPEAQRTIGTGCEPAITAAAVIFRGQS